MDPGSLFLSVWVLMVCLPGAAHCGDCPCPEIPTHSLTVPAQQGCYHIGSTFRYKCVDGYVRKAGTSNLIKCLMSANGLVWSNSRLSCIPDPKIPVTQPPRATVTTPSTSQQTTYDASVSASVTAKTESTDPTSSGSVQWTLSDHTQGKTLKVTHESVTVTRAAAWTTSTSTLSLSTVKSNINSVHAPRTGVVISCVSLMIFAVIGISLCYRRRSRNNMPPQTEEEGIPMNHELSSGLAV